VAIVGADTIIKEDGSMQTTAIVELKADGSTANVVEVTNATGEKVSAEINVAIVGADTTVKSDGAVETVAEVTTADNVKTDVQSGDTTIALESGSVLIQNCTVK